MPELARWKCHKVVRAGKIKSLKYETGGFHWTLEIEGVDGPFAVTVGEGVFSRGVPDVGDYFVVYDDDYRSWSPAKAFEEGYELIQDEP